MFNDLPGTITAIGTLLAAIGALILTLRNGRTQGAAKEAAEAAAAEAKRAANEAAFAASKLVKIDGAIYETRKALDGRLSKLLEEVEKRSFAEGKAEGKTEEKADEKDRKNGPQ